MRRHIVLTAILASIAALPALAADTPPEACTAFARPFYLIARNRDRGITKDTAISNYKRNKSRPEDADPAMPANWMTLAITSVYNYPTTPADELQRRAEAACSVDAEGKVQFRGL